MRLQCFTLAVLLAHIDGRNVDEQAVKRGIARIDLVCFTCPKYGDNEECNRWAPNIGCPQNQTVCQTVHMFNTKTSESIFVEKRCVRPKFCSNNHIGCEASDDGSSKRCTSCCMDSLCNEEVPIDGPSAIKLSSIHLPTNSAQQQSIHSFLALVLMLMAAAAVFL